MFDHMEIISRREIQSEGWIPSIGMQLDKEHFREPPPGKRHAEFDVGAEYGVVHHDPHNPLAGPVELGKHLWDWSPLGTLFLAYGAYKLLK